MATAERVRTPELVEQYTAPAVDVVVPVRDEARVLAASIRRLHAYLTDSFPWSFRITVADNGSSDGTWEVAAALAVELPHVRAVSGWNSNVAYRTLNFDLGLKKAMTFPSLA